MAFYYEKRWGSYYYLRRSNTPGLDDEIVFMADEVSICFDVDPEMWTLHKHGPRGRVEEWFTKTVVRYRECGLGDLAASMHILTSSEWDVDDLNNMIATTGFVQRVVEKAGFQLAAETEE